MNLLHQLSLETGFIAALLITNGQHLCKCSHGPTSQMTVMPSSRTNADVKVLCLSYIILSPNQELAFDQNALVRKIYPLLKKKIYPVIYDDNFCLWSGFRVSLDGLVEI